MANELTPMPPEGQLLIYQDEDLRVQVRIDGHTAAELIHRRADATKPKGGEQNGF